MLIASSSLFAIIILILYRAIPKNTRDADVSYRFKNEQVKYNLFSPISSSLVAELVHPYKLGIIIFRIHKTISSLNI